MRDHRRYPLLVLFLTFALCLVAPALARAQALNLYDDFSASQIDAAKWRNLEVVREVRNGRLALKYRDAREPGFPNLSVPLANPSVVSSLFADVRMNAYTISPGNSAVLRLRGAYYNDGSAGGGQIGDVSAQLFLAGEGTPGTVNVRYQVYKCANTDCSSVIEIVPKTIITTVGLGEIHRLGISWNGTAFTFSVDGQPTVVDGALLPPVVNATAAVPDRQLGAQLAMRNAGGGASVDGDFDNVEVNGALYDNFDGAPYSGPRLDSTKWTALELVREIQNDRLVSKIGYKGAAGTIASSLINFANKNQVTAVQADVTVTEVESGSNTFAQARLVGGIFYNDGASTGSSDFTGDMGAHLRIKSYNNGNLVIAFLTDRCADATCATSTNLFEDEIATTSLGATHTLFLKWDGAVFTYGVQDLGITRTYDPKVGHPVVKPGLQQARDMRTRVLINTANTYGYIAATYDNVHVNSEATRPPRLTPSYRALIAGDVTSAGVGLRGTGSGTITLTGLPGGAVVQKAFLYWSTIGGGGTATAPTLNGQAVTGTLIGQSDDPSWRTAQTYAYRADVTSLVSGNGSYTIAGLPVGPLPPASFAIGDSEGASLVVVYNLVAATPRVITINDGAMTLSPSLLRYYATSLEGFVAATPPTGASLTFVVGDGQTFTSEYAGLSSTLLSTNEFSGSNGNYWDTRTYDVSGVISGGTTTATASISTGNDSLVWVAAILSVPGRLHTDAVGVFRPADGTFYLDYNASGQWDGCGTDRCLQIGLLNDIPLVGDWNGSGTAKVGAFRPSDGTFYLDYNGSGTWDGCGADRCLQIGLNGDIPLVGDWNGSGTSKVGAFRPSDGTFYLDYNGSGTWDGCGTDRCLQIGLNGDIPLVGDWNGSGTSKVGAFRPSDGTFYLDYNGSGTWEGCGVDRCLQIGMLNDIPLVGDWNGTGTSKVGVFRRSDGTFYVDYNGSGTWDGCGTDRCLQIGMLNDTPLVGDWDGSGTAKVGVFRPSDGTFYLDYDGSGTWNGCGTDRCLQIGLNGDTPLVGKW